jgi:hypothetical protein
MRPTPDHDVRGRGARPGSVPGNAGWRRAAVVALAVPVLACLDPLGPDSGGDGFTPPELGEADVRILFVGNSLTYTNGLPGVVARVASATGRSVAHASLAQPNWSLEEHWHAGLEDHIRALRPDVVVLQQGPSTLPASRDHLVYWTELIAPVVAEGGGETALLGVWPPRSRLEFFDDGIASYTAASDAVDGILIPAAGTWLEAWDRDPDILLYGPDGFHPSYLGTLAAAYTTAAVLLGVPADSLPALDDSATPEQVAVLRQAVAASVAATAVVDPAVP